jgi:hypothetical protein
MRYKLRVAAWASILCSIVLAGCGGDGDGGGSGGSSSSIPKGVPDADGREPFDVLKAGIMAGNEGDYDTAATWVVPSGGMVGDNFMLWQKATNNGTVQKVEHTGEQYQGQDVSVGYTIHFEDGSSKSDKATLVKVDGRWKIEWLSTGF